MITRQPQPTAETLTPASREYDRKKLERDTKKFLKQGGKIQKLPPGLRSESAPQDVIDYEP
jgi:hypothetical protein